MRRVQPPRPSGPSSVRAGRDHSAVSLLGPPVDDPAGTESLRDGVSSFARSVGSVSRRDLAGSASRVGAQGRGRRRAVGSGPDARHVRCRRTLPIEVLRELGDRLEEERPAAVRLLPAQGAPATDGSSRGPLEGGAPPFSQVACRVRARSAPSAPRRRSAPDSSDVPVRRALRTPFPIVQSGYVPSNSPVLPTAHPQPTGGPHRGR